MRQAATSRTASAVPAMRSMPGIPGEITVCCQRTLPPRVKPQLKEKTNATHWKQVPDLGNLCQ